MKGWCPGAFDSAILGGWEQRRLSWGVQGSPHLCHPASIILSKFLVQKEESTSKNKIK